jgi:hypothetical protein
MNQGDFEFDDERREDCVTQLCERGVPMTSSLSCGRRGRVGLQGQLPCVGAKVAGLFRVSDYRRHPAVRGDKGMQLFGAARIRGMPRSARLNCKNCLEKLKHEEGADKNGRSGRRSADAQSARDPPEVFRRHGLGHESNCRRREEASANGGGQTLLGFVVAVRNRGSAGAGC